MTLQQLEYIVALDGHRQFYTAAAACFVTQPSLSAQVQKLEEELGVKIFDRSRQPVRPTETGILIIEQARIILRAAKRLPEMVNEVRSHLSGTLHIGIIPTLAPYLLPIFLKAFTEKHPDIRLIISELTTENIIAQLKKDQIDAGILAGPLHDHQLVESPVFYERFVVYAPHENTVLNKEYLLSEDIDVSKLILLEEGHCLRTQVINLCALIEQRSTRSNVIYQSGSLEAIRRLVEIQGGITILPELALLNFSEAQLKNVRYFQEPAPVREVSLVLHRGHLKANILDGLYQTIITQLPEKMLRKDSVNIISID